MAVGLPMKTSYANGDVYSAQDVNDITGTINAYVSTGKAAAVNKFINGNFGVWQRGTSFSVNSTSAYTADRWYCTSGSTTTTFSQVAFTPGAAPVSGYESAYYLNCAATSATASTTYVEQRIEDVRTLAGQTATISFWAKASTATTLTLRLDQSFGSGGSGGVANTVGTVSVTTAWVRYSATIAVPSVSGKTIGAGSYLDFFLYYSNAASLNVSFWGFQIEAGSTATIFQTATGTIQGELALCQRYLPAITGSTGSAIGYAVAVNKPYYVIQFPVTARTAPTGLTTTGSFSGYVGGTQSSITPAFDSANTYSASITGSMTISVTAATILFYGGTILFTGCEL
jgi:hypothetical protein